MSVLPIWSHQVEPGVSGYAPRPALLDALHQGGAAMSWWLGNRLSSLRLTAGGIWKVRDRLEPIPPGVEPDRWLAALAGAGVRHCSSYADAYHQLAPPVPPLPYTFNGMFSEWAGGPWSEARTTGSFRGAWYRYDLRSAYRWAATLGLPVPGELEAQHGGDVQEPGLWWVRLRGRVAHLPSCFREPRPVVMSTEELEGYGVAYTLIRGVRFGAMLPADYVEATLRRLPCAKESGRAYWGRWIARDPLRVQADGKEWQVPNRMANFIYGWLIVGRVRLRMWERAERAAHVYVDELLVPHPMDTGQGAGDWHLKEMYPTGVTVHRTGWYAGRGAPATMRTGEPSPGRAA